MRGDLDSHPPILTLPNVSRRHANRLTPSPRIFRKHFTLPVVIPILPSVVAELVFLPPYGPDLNPIELIFSKVKQLLRSLAFRTREVLWSAMQSVLDQSTESDTVHCFRHCGYRYTFLQGGTIQYLAARGQTLIRVTQNPRQP